MEALTGVQYYKKGCFNLWAHICSEAKRRCFLKDAADVADAEHFSKWAPFQTLLKWLVWRWWDQAATASLHSWGPPVSLKEQESKYAFIFSLT